MCEKPNILFVLADDMGAWAMRNAGNPEIFTPTLDALAANGIRFENFFCASPVCSPARASILTGRMPSAHGVHDWLRGGNLDIDEYPQMSGDPSFASEEHAIGYLDGMTCYTDLLAHEGYQLALSGKWHAGNNAHAQHGFPQDKWYTIGRGGCYYMHPDMLDRGELKYEDTYVTNLFTDRAIEYLDGFDVEKPFYLSVHYTAPHSPWENDQHPAEFISLYKDCEFKSIPDPPYHPFASPTAPKGKGEERKAHLRGYFAAISAMDAGIGRIIDKLRQMDALDNTIIIFMGDNGMNMGHHGIWGKGNGTFPANMYDTSVKVPLIISAPSILPRGKVCSSLTTQLDMLPTIADFLGVAVPQNEHIAGQSMLPLLSNPDCGHGEVVICDEYGPTRMIRTKTQKLVYRHPYGPNEFYDLVSDPDEADNRYDDPSCIHDIEHLTEALYEWFAKYSDPAKDGKAEGVTGFGQLRKHGAASLGKPAWFVHENDKYNKFNLENTKWHE